VSVIAWTAVMHSGRQKSHSYIWHDTFVEFTEIISLKLFQKTETRFAKQASRCHRFRLKKMADSTVYIYYTYDALSSLVEIC